MQFPPVEPTEGMGVLHLFLTVDVAASADEPAAGKALAETLDFWSEQVQLHVFSVMGHKADIMLMALDGDLVQLRALQTAVMRCARAGMLRMTWSYLSLTEGSEYTTTPEQYRAELAAKNVVEPDLSRRVDEFAERMQKYTQDKLYPQMPAWELACFYPMSHRREGSDNWYSLDFERRKELMHDHGKSGRAYTGRVVQLVSGSTGLDDWEWGVTLFSHNIADLKEIVYQLRYDEASARYAEFGPFIVGMRRSPAELVTELGLVGDA